MGDGGLAGGGFKSCGPAPCAPTTPDRPPTVVPARRTRRFDTVASVNCIAPEIRLAVGSIEADSNRICELAASVIREPSFIEMTKAESRALTRSPAINGHELTPA